MESAAGKKRLQDSVKIFKQSFFQLIIPHDTGAGNTNVSNGFSGKYPPQSCFQSSLYPFLFGFGDDSPVKLCFTTTHSPDPLGF